MLLKICQRMQWVPTQQVWNCGTKRFTPTFAHPHLHLDWNQHGFHWWTSSLSRKECDNGSCGSPFNFSKYAHFISLSHPYNAKIIASLFVDHIFRLHGMPLSIVSNHDPTFLSGFWMEFFKLQGTVLKMSTAYHSQSDGQTEIVNCFLETYLHCFTSSRPKEWSKWLSCAEWWYNTNIHEAPKLTLYEVVYGVPPPHFLSYVKGTTRVQAVNEVLTIKRKN